MNDLQSDEFDWAWGQAPCGKVIEALEENGRFPLPWDRLWIFAGPLYAPYGPTTLCPCKRRSKFIWPQGEALESSGLLSDPLVYLDNKIQLVDDATKQVIKIAIGSCDFCKTVYWQTNEYKDVI
jgi:hypothetical protein